MENYMYTEWLCLLQCIYVWQHTYAAGICFMENIIHCRWNDSLGGIASGQCTPMITLQWRHSENDGVSIHQRRDCLLNRLFRRRSEKISKPVTGEFPHKGPVTRKVYLSDDVIIKWRSTSTKPMHAQLFLFDHSCTPFLFAAESTSVLWCRGNCHLNHE